MSPARGASDNIVSVVSMAKVLKTKRGATTSYALPDGVQYTFFAGEDHKACAGMELVHSDAHAKALLAKFPDELSEVQEKDWPERYKKGVIAATKARIQEAAEKFPELIGQKIPEPDKKEEKKDAKK